MASKRFIRELRDELPGWVHDRLIDETTADVLALRYTANPRSAARTAGHYLQIFLGILCAALTGSGLILLISHNWDQFTPGVRLAFACGPLAVTIPLGGFVLLRRENDPRWCEPAALLLMAASASAIAIVSQVYQILGTLNDFLLLWLALMVLPIYCFRSAALAAVFGCGFAALILNGFRNLPFWQPLLLALTVLPHLRYAADDVRSAGTRHLAQLTLGALLLFLNIAGAKHDGLLSTTYWSWPVLFTTLLLAGRHLAAKHREATDALCVIGFVGFFGILLAATFQDFWRPASRFEFEAGGAVWCYLALLTLVWLLFLWRFRHSGGTLFAGGMPLVFAAGIVLGRYYDPVWAMLLSNLYTAGLGVGMLVFGYRARSIRQMNGGLAILAILLVLRFCNVGNIILYAAVFLILGVMVGIANLIFARQLKKREDAP